MKNSIYKIALIGIVLTGIFSCKKDQSSSLEIAITADEMHHLNTSVNIKEVWLNYATKKSNSEWVKLEIASGIYDLSDLYLDQRDTILLTSTVVEKATTLLQLRFAFHTDSNSVITQGNDTLSMTMESSALNGLKVSLNKGIDFDRFYILKLAITGDSTLLYQPEPVFSPVIRVDELKVKI